jgi:PAS domain-containing protein
MDIVFIYGLAFLVLGVVIVIWPKAGSRFEFARLSLWLAGFAFVHGTLEWMDLWRVVRGDNPALAAARPLTLLASYLLLFEFGRRTLRAAQPEAPQAVGRGWVHGLLLGASPRAASPTLRPSTAWPSGRATSTVFRPRCCRPSGCRPTSASASAASCRHEFPTVRRNCLLAGAAFTAYGVLGGLIVPQAPGPAAWLNQEGFLAAVGVPVQIFRAGCAVMIAFSMARVLQIFHLEQQQHLAQTLQQTAAALEEAGRLGRHNRLLLESVAEGIFGLDTEGRTTFINPVALALLGYQAAELIGQPCTPSPTTAGPTAGPTPSAPARPTRPCRTASPATWPTNTSAARTAALSRLLPHRPGPGAGPGDRRGGGLRGHLRARPPRRRTRCLPPPAGAAGR